MYRIDLNADLGESFGNYKLGMDAEVIPFLTSVNVACGFHASDPVVMEKTVALAAAGGVQIGAHPGFPDLQGFGRREMNVTAEEAEAMVLYQLGALGGFCKAHGVSLGHVKAHGALYNMAAKDMKLALAIGRAVKRYDPELIYVGLSGSKMADAAQELGLRFASEVFADRAYEEDGTLVSRRKPGAMITDEDLAIERVCRMIKEGVVEAVTGRDIIIKADTVCIHGDSPKALLFAEKIRRGLAKAGIEIKPVR